ncbi:MAG: type II secretion system F family protein [Candidatus Nanohaloarchaeota archaeon]|nr:type II secretion system F family protein [Candidatus Nanohaloarchaeota archaeon]
MMNQPSPAMLKKASYFYPIAAKLEKSLKHLKVYLYQAKWDINLVEHISYSLFVASINTFYFIVAMLTLWFFTKNYVFLKLLLASVFVFLLMFYSALYKPKVIALRRARMMEEELPYALRHLLIQIKSGVPLYQGFVSISKGYGEISREFKEIIKKINSGYSEIKALEESVLRSASQKYRKAFWQILNSMKTGTDITTPLENTVNEIIKDQILSIKNYGQQLNPLTLMYMMMAVIMPSLGITFLVIISSFVGFNIPSLLFIGMAFFLIIFQWSFLNMIKTKRPNVKI